MSLCLSLSASSFEECKRILETLAEEKCSVIVEVRVDLISEHGKGQVTNEQLAQIFSFKGLKKIATVRDLTAAGFTLERQNLLRLAMESGADWIDIEYEAPAEYRDKLIKVAKEKGTTVIISYHNYESTPNIEELREIVGNCYAFGGEVAKVATSAKSTQDSARILSLYDTEKPVVALAMGKFGEITRVAATKLGASFTFVSMSAEAATAPGQLSLQQMKTIMQNMSV